MQNTILRANDIVAILNIAKPTFYRWVKEGICPAGFKYGPNTTGWPREVVEQWLAEKAAKSSAQ
ncbi:AlpA family phage regulatory protein [Pseudomonas sp. R-28-1W-6]|uniref:helix-turn-helix transcriptional regulator n=1 Tax=Pseudomonas sp. R-28-1W-6 TaxID=2650101 RepID=UPI00136642D7|nr:helix-turn-helix domain-containing protein [Pseudomonas sp. R-28-1W-6]MWV11155.1 AlpA family phage regulatory protein [Pseudomonas sp. R-28-1W-6]